MNKTCRLQKIIYFSILFALCYLLFAICACENPYMLRDLEEIMDARGGNEPLPPEPRDELPELTGISADYNQSFIVYPATPLENLKNDLTVTAFYDDNTSSLLNDDDYSLSGVLEVGSSLITVSYFEFTDSITVEVTPAPDYGITLSESGTYSFTAVEGYTTVPQLTITVTNIGNHATGDLDIELSGADTDRFILSKSIIASLTMTTDDDDFIIKPDTGLAPGKYTATVTVSGANDISESFDIEFVVIPTHLVTVNVNDAAGGTATPDTPTLFAYGETVTITATPSSGYTFEGWTVNAGGITLGNTDTETFAMPDEPVTITANFQQKAVTNITLSPALPSSMLAGDAFTFNGTVVPSDALNQTIVWSVASGPGTLAGNILTANTAGTVTVRATITDGVAAGTDYTQDFVIKVNAKGIFNIEFVDLEEDDDPTLSPSNAGSIRRSFLETLTITINETDFTDHKWYVDGVLKQTGGTAFTINAIEYAEKEYTAALTVKDADGKGYSAAIKFTVVP